MLSIVTAFCPQSLLSCDTATGPQGNPPQMLCPVLYFLIQVPYSLVLASSVWLISLVASKPGALQISVEDIVDPVIFVQNPSLNNLKNRDT